MAHILIAEDEQRIASFIDKGLSANGFAVTIVGDGPSAFEYARTGDFDLMVLDIGLPGMDGFEVLRRLRSEGHRVPVIVLTARSSVADTVAGLEGGADDYMAKPFRFEELLARVRLRLAPTRVADAAVLSCGGLQLDLHTRRALVEGRSVDLSAREFALAETFLRHAGQVLSRQQQLSQVWGYDYDPGHQRCRRVRALSAPQARYRPLRHPARHGVPVGCHALVAARAAVTVADNEAERAETVEATIVEEPVVAESAVVVEAEVVVAVVGDRCPGTRSHETGDARRNDEDLAYRMCHRSTPISRNR